MPTTPIPRDRSNFGSRSSLGSSTPRTPGITKLQNGLNVACLQFIFQSFRFLDFSFNLFISIRFEFFHPVLIVFVVLNFHLNKKKIKSHNP